eukprot:1111697-Amphidinium_carterae.1
MASPQNLNGAQEVTQRVNLASIPFQPHVTTTLHIPNDIKTTHSKNLCLWGFRGKNETTCRNQTGCHRNLFLAKKGTSQPICFQQLPHPFLYRCVPLMGRAKD